MSWRWIELESNDKCIQNVAYKLEENKSYGYKLTWKWPSEIKHVYVDTRGVDEDLDLSRIVFDTTNICTIAEFQSNHGCRNKKELLKGGNHQLVRIFPVIVSDNQEKLVIAQDDKENSVIIQSPKAKVTVEIQEKKSFLSKTKDIEIKVFSPDIDISEDALYYRSKKGSRPVNDEEGTYHIFTSGVRRGEVKSFHIYGLSKEEYMNVFCQRNDLIRLERV